MKRLFATVFAISILLFCFSGCSDNSEKDYPVKIANYTFNTKPKAVVCLNDSVADILIACGYSDVITARSDECTQEELKELPSVGKKSNPDVKKIIKFSPDVVFADKTLDNDISDNLKNSDIKVLTMVYAQTTDDLTMLYKNICSVVNGNVTGRNNGENKAQSILNTMNDLQRIIPKNDVVVTACYLYDTDGTAAYENTLCGKIFSYANIVNVCTENSNSDSSDNKLKSIRLSNPQYIFCDKGIKEKILTDKNFKDFAAVKSQNIYEIDSSVFERQGNSLTTVLSYIIETVYPNLSSLSKPTTISSNENNDGSSAESSNESNNESSAVTADNSLEITDDMQYEKGEENDNIKIIQERLINLGFMDEDATGYYGDVTVAAIKSFEEKNNITVDGIADNNDLKLLFSADVKSNNQ